MSQRRQIAGLLDFVVRLTPRFLRPHHLQPFADIAERIARGESVRVVTSVPPRFAKTETLLAMIVWLLLRDEDMEIIYASYAARIAEKKSRHARDLARKAGVALSDDASSRQDWRTEGGTGGVWATGVGGAVTGEGGRVLICDDPHKGRAEAESAATRDQIYEWFKGDFVTRGEPSASILVNQTRWHPDDLAGRLIGEGWEHVTLPAITAAGDSLWPERWTIDELHRMQRTLGEYEWDSLYMGAPRGRGSRVFSDVQTYAEAPRGLQIAIGLDFAYSSRTHADWSVAVVLGGDGTDYYVLDVVRVRAEPRDFRSRIELLTRTHAGAACYAHAAATEMGGIEFLREAGIPVHATPARADKFTRAIPVAAAWNSGKIFLPRSAPWLDAFVSEVCGFTGVRDRHDDQVDSLAAAFDGLAGTEVDLRIGYTRPHIGRGWGAARGARGW